jgi:hypothetical protein
MDFDSRGNQSKFNQTNNLGLDQFIPGSGITLPKEKIKTKQNRK